MRRSPSTTPLLMLLLLCLPVAARAEHSGIHVELSPRLPTSQDQVQVLLRGSTVPGCHFLDFPDQVDAAAGSGTPVPGPKRIQLIGQVEHILVLCPAVDWTDTVDLVNLAPGTYELEVYSEDPGAVPSQVLLYELLFTVTGSSDQLELHNGSIVVAAKWIGGPQAGQVLHAVAQSAESGYFWSFGSGNVELTAKTLDGSLVNDHLWNFLAPMTSLGIEATVYDRRNGCVLEQCPHKVYTLSPGQPDSIIDAEAFVGSLP
jgi:hypothetical protein